MNLLFHNISKGSQHTLAEWAYAFGERRLRIRVRSDNCDFQSHARADIWDAAGLKWNRVADVHYGEMKTEPNLYLQRQWDNESCYRADHDELLRRAALILPGLGRDDDARLGSWYIAGTAEGDCLYIRRDGRPGSINVTADDEGFDIEVWDSDAAGMLATCAVTYDDLDANLPKS
jgi:hypothetical protein